MPQEVESSSFNFNVFTAVPNVWAIQFENSVYSDVIFPKKVPQDL